MKVFYLRNTQTFTIEPEVASHPDFIALKREGKASNLINTLLRNHFLMVDNINPDRVALQREIDALSQQQQAINDDLVFKRTQMERLIVNDEANKQRVLSDVLDNTRAIKDNNPIIYE